MGSLDSGEPSVTFQARGHSGLDWTLSSGHVRPDKMSRGPPAERVLWGRAEIQRGVATLKGLVSGSLSRGAW